MKKPPRLFSVLLISSVALVLSLAGLKHFTPAAASGTPVDSSHPELSGAQDHIPAAPSADNTAETPAAPIIENSADAGDISAPDSAADTAPTETAGLTRPALPPTIGPVDADYFQDALFIGDSRTVGLSEYGTLAGASFFADVGMSVYRLEDSTISDTELGEINLEQLLSARTYGKIYLMLGINELGCSQETTIQKYSDLVARIRELQPEAYLILEANLHVGAERSNTDSVFNNAAIDSFNERVAALADQQTVFYLDVNTLFDDEAGNLCADYTSDGTHVYGKYYAQWSDWLYQNGVVPAVR